MNRRKFIQGISVTTLAALASQTVFPQNSTAKLKIVIFWQDDFLVIDGLNLTREKLQNALSNHHLVFANETDLITQLDADIDVFINPYGSAFPKKCWSAILKYLQSGGNLLNLGGVPFAVPVQNLKPENRQVNYHKRLGITQSFPVKSGNITTWVDRYNPPRTRSDEVRESVLLLLSDIPKFSAEEIYELYLKLSNVNDFPEELGSNVRREAKVEALIFGLDDNKRRIAAPIIQIDRLHGEFAGGRWIFANYKGEIDNVFIKILAETASFGAFDFEILPNFACYRSNEVPTLKMKFIKPDNNKNQLKLLTENMEIGVPYSKTAFYKSLLFNEPSTVYEIKARSLSDVSKRTPGFYPIKIEYDLLGGNGLRCIVNKTTGFWVLDDELLATGQPFTTDKHFFYRNDQPFPVAGTTYMASDVARRFLLEPNPTVWDKDFQEMKAAGVNMVRTGIWAGWKLYFDEKGEVREEVLRAFEAFILISKRYDIPVIFTFFAFMPEMFSGKNAYLDPVSIAGQKKFLSAFASRVKTARDVI
jgi:hypothetical protein